MTAATKPAPEPVSRTARCTAADVAIGRTLAREFFSGRGNRTEAHIRETTLAGLLALAAQAARTQAAPED